MITKVRLKNWKSHLESEFSFSPGVNALVGLMGAGKSSVTDAISFGLFGSFPALQSRRVAMDQLVMERPQKKGFAVVEVEFLADGKSYQVKREIERGKGSSAEIREDGQLREVSSRQVTREVERILGMDYDVFSKAVYSEQNGIDYFLRIPAGRRREHIDRMLKVDRFERARGEAVSLQNRIGVGIEERVRLAASLEGEGLEGKAKAANEEVEKLRKRVDSLQEGEKQAEKSRALLEGKVSGAEETEKELEKTNRLLAGLMGGLEGINKAEGRSRKIVRGMDLGKIDAEILKLQEAVESRKQLLDELKGEVYAFLERKKASSESLEKIGKLGDKCPLCESELSPEKRERLAAEKEKMVDSLSEDIAKKSKQLSLKEEELKALEQSLGDKRVERERVSDAFQEIKELGEKFKEILEIKQRYECEIERLEEGVVGLDLKKLRAELQESIARERELAAESRELGKRLEDKADVCRDIENRLGLLKTYRQDVKESQIIVEQLKGFGQALKLTQEQLRTRFLENVNLILEQVWGELYPYKDFTSVRLAVDGGDYSLQLKAGEWRDAEAVSGGERSLACLALRVAFSLAFLPNLKWLILDEPTHNLDERAVAALAGVLQEKITSFAEQIFLITHDSALSAGLPNTCFLERDKGKGEPTQVRGT